MDLIGLAQMAFGDGQNRTQTEPTKSVKLYTLIKDYAQHKYNADDNTVMKLYIGTKRAAEITDNGALIAYVDGKLKPKQPEPKQTTVSDDTDEQPAQPEPIGKTDETTEQPEPTESGQPTEYVRPEQIELDFGQNDDIMEIRENILNADVARYKNKIRITVTEPDRDLELAYKMKQLGYKYNTKRGLSYFFVKM